MRPPVSPISLVTLLLLLGSVVVLQAVRERHPLQPLPQTVVGQAPAVESPAFVTRAALSFDAIAADVYWMRVVQRYGQTKLSEKPGKRYDFLYPLLDITTSLDPEFEIAYRFGAIFLAEEYPGGAGRPDLAIALLQKGLSSQPTKWEYAQDIAFVHYWWRRDYHEAAEWFSRAAKLPEAPDWLAAVAAVTLTQGGDRVAARRLWTDVLNGADADWLADQARRRLIQLDALDQIDALEARVSAYKRRTGSLPHAWSDLIREGLLSGVPLDSDNAPYQLNPYWGTVGVAEESSLSPLPTDRMSR